MKVIISGGGTGGHIYPALSIAEEISKNNSEAEILYVGTKNGLESELVPRERYNFETVRVKYFPRKIGIKQLVAIKELVIGIFQSRKIIKKFKPDIVIGTGGYVCGPICLMAYLNKIPIVLHEQNALPGITTKILSKYASKILLTYEEAKKYLKNTDKCVLTGNPVRSELLDGKTESIDLIKNINLPIILSYGGSGGQESINDAIFNMIIDKKGDFPFYLIHVTGSSSYNKFMEKLERTDFSDLEKKNIKILPYIYEMPAVLKKTTLVITSAGAITLAELSALGIPSILIPKAYAAENHQEHNARVFENLNAAEMILEKDLDYKVLEEKILELLNNDDKMNKMRKNSYSLGNREASKLIYDEIIKTLT